ncbi:putative ABC transport system permease protein [Chitinophaga sp. YR627]|nr:putative ABC transport system permease protein [Chitinophaga sp. YR627]
MFKNYLKIIFRNIIHHKSCATINVPGLAIGMAAVI